MKEYRFIQVDVFTDRPFGGNPLAVFPDAQGLSDEEMQALAQEMNLSETAFVLPPRSPEADFRVRIFTPGEELPFAGHPVVGTHWVLAHLGRVALQEPRTVVRFELGVGVLPADLHVEAGRVQQVVMTQARPQFLGLVDDIAGLAAGLGVPPQAITETGLPVQIVSTGLPQMIVPLRTLTQVQALARLNLDALSRVCEPLGTDCVVVFCRQTVAPEVAVHVRMFAPQLGVPEDPATGSANGALGAYLVRYGAVLLTPPTTSIESEQGLEMGRPSRLHIEVDHDQHGVRAVRVGGQVAPVAEGVVRF
ncbi:MAG: PhzF family phenazine biosynthesis protein [Chloroflexi bacterium]|nr:PhzF family phenazine biosynthesis protein [Chloroflexota bacterium]